MFRRRFLSIAALAGLSALTGCQTTNSEWEGIQSSRLAMNETIKTEPCSTIVEWWNVEFGRAVARNGEQK